MSKHIGIIACSAEGAALCYRTICKESPQKMGEHMHPEVSMHTYPLGEYMPYIRAPLPTLDSTRLLARAAIKESGKEGK